MFICVVCGYDKLETAQYNDNGIPTFNICQCCGFQSGYDDLDQGNSFEEYREKWINNGAKWFRPKEKPSNWDFKGQLKNIPIEYREV